MNPLYRSERLRQWSYCVLGRSWSLFSFRGVFLFLSLQKCDFIQFCPIISVLMLFNFWDNSIVFRANLPSRYKRKLVDYKFWFILKTLFQLYKEQLQCAVRSFYPSWSISVSECCCKLLTQGNLKLFVVPMQEVLGLCRRRWAGFLNVIFKALYCSTMTYSSECLPILGIIVQFMQPLKDGDGIPTPYRLRTMVRNTYWKFTGSFWKVRYGNVTGTKFFLKWMTGTERRRIHFWRFRCGTGTRTNLRYGYGNGENRYGNINIPGQLAHIWNKYFFSWKVLTLTST